MVSWRIMNWFEIEEYSFKRVLQFKYLGSIITQDNNAKTEVPSGIQQANKGYYGLEYFKI